MESATGVSLQAIVRLLEMVGEKQAALPINTWGAMTEG